MKMESVSEGAARILVEKILGISFRFHDKSGEVDFVSSVDGLASLEVTTITNQKKMQLDKEFKHANYLISRQDIQKNWWIHVSGVPNFKKLQNDLFPTLVDLEVHGIDRVDMNLHGWWLKNVPTLNRVLHALETNKVISTTTNIGFFRDQNIATERFVAITSGENWKFGGFETSLEDIEELVKSDINNIKKLVAAACFQSHLFFWFNGNSDKNFREIFSEKNFRYPSRPAVLPDGVTDLWLADEVTGQFLHFNNKESWQLGTI